MTPYTYSQIYRGRLLSAASFGHLLKIENVPREWYTHINDKYTILHVPGCNRTLHDGDDAFARDLCPGGIDATTAPVVPWSTVLGRLGHVLMDELVNISEENFVQLRKYLTYAASPNEKDGIYILRTLLGNMGDLNSMTIQCNIRVNVDFYMNFAHVYDMQRRSLDNENRPYLKPV